MSDSNFIARYFLARWLLCAFVVFATYNPSGYSLFNWLQSSGSDDLAIKAVIVIALFWFYLTILSIARSAMGARGLNAAILAVALLLYGLMDIDNSSETVLSFLRYIQIFTLATALAIGVTWTKIKSTVVGQKSVRRLN
jgi:hypothetical protein